MNGMPMGLRKRIEALGGRSRPARVGFEAG